MSNSATAWLAPWKGANLFGILQSRPKGPKARLGGGGGLYDHGPGKSNAFSTYPESFSHFPDPIRLRLSGDSSTSATGAL